MPQQTWLIFCYLLELEDPFFVNWAAVFIKFNILVHNDSQICNRAFDEWLKATKINKGVAWGSVRNE